VLAVAPGAARAVLVVPLAAWNADHGLHCACLYLVCAGAGRGGVDRGAMKAETGGVVTLVTPRRFRSVGEWYAEFGQLTDSDVLTLLAALR
jgi:hypothetical protein